MRWREERAAGNGVGVRGESGEKAVLPSEWRQSSKDSSENLKRSSEVVGWWWGPRYCVAV